MTLHSHITLLLDIQQSSPLHGSHSLLVARLHCACALGCHANLVCHRHTRSNHPLYGKRLKRHFYHPFFQFNLLGIVRGLLWCSGRANPPCCTSLHCNDCPRTPCFLARRLHSHAVLFSEMPSKFLTMHNATSIVFPFSADIRVAPLSLIIASPRKG